MNVKVYERHDPIKSRCHSCFVAGIIRKIDGNLICTECNKPWNNELDEYIVSSILSKLKMKVGGECEAQ